MQRQVAAQMTAAAACAAAAAAARAAAVYSEQATPTDTKQTMPNTVVW